MERLQRKRETTTVDGSDACSRKNFPAGRMHCWPFCVRGRGETDAEEETHHRRHRGEAMAAELVRLRVEVVVGRVEEDADGAALHV